jgi:hypothetical protein
MAGTDGALRGYVTHRLDIRTWQGAVTLFFQGLLDAEALEKLQAGVRRASAGGGAVRVVLREGTDVDRECVEALRALGAEVIAESRYLARWIRGDAP